MDDSHNSTAVEVDATASDRTQIHRVALKIPPFWADEPLLWFAQIESQFALGGITQDATKYAYVLAHIETKYAREIKDLIINPPAANRYEAVKEALIRRLSVSQEQQIRQLLEQEEMGDRKPSQFLRHLRALTDVTMPEPLLRTLWMGRLPPQVQAILVTRQTDSLETIAEQADRVYEVTGRAATVASIQPDTSANSGLEQEVKELTKQVASLMSRCKEEKNKKWERSRSSSRERREKGICYYHHRFKEAAKKCTKPCSFKKEGNE